MVCGIRLAEAGKRCAIVSQGQSALHFSSGSFDLLSRLPDGTAVNDPMAGIVELEKMAPEHPYSVLGSELCEKYARQVPEVLRSAGIAVEGDCCRNHYRITPLGKAKATWLTMSGYLTADSLVQLPFKKVCIVNGEGFLDFYPEFIAEEFRKYGVTCSFGSINFPDLEQIRKNPSEMRSANIARVFDREENLEALAAKISEVAADSEAVILPAIIGINRNDSFEVLKSKVSLSLYLLPTLPPSIPGIKAQQALQNRFRALGGEYSWGIRCFRPILKAIGSNRSIRPIMAIFLSRLINLFWRPAASSAKGWWLRRIGLRNQFSERIPFSSRIVPHGTRCASLTNITIRHSE